MEDEGYGHFISLSVCWSGTIALAVTNSLANSASEAENMSTLIIWARDMTGPLSRGIGYIFERCTTLHGCGRDFH